MFCLIFGLVMNINSTDTVRPDYMRTLRDISKKIVVNFHDQASSGRLGISAFVDYIDSPAWPRICRIQGLVLFSSLQWHKQTLEPLALLCSSTKTR
jgi:hypothetical protein